MKKLYFFFFLLVTACNNTSVTDENKNNDTSEAYLNEVSKDLLIFVNSQNITSFEDVQNYLAKYGDNVSSKIQNDILVISLPDNCRIDVDLYGKSLIQPMDWKNYDEAGIEAFGQDICNNLGLSDEEEEILSSSQNRTQSKPQTRTVTRGTGDIEVNRDVLIWALEDKEVQKVVNRMEIVNNYLKNTYDGNRGLKINRIYKGKECTPSTMKEFSKYGLVFMVAHGHPETGELLFPASDNWEKAQDSYAKEFKALANKLNHVVIVRNSKDSPGELFYALDAIHLNSLLPDLNKTVVWTCVCYAQRENSETKKGIESRLPAFFAGSATKTEIGNPLEKFERFARLFYAGDEAKTAWRESGMVNSAYVYSKLENSVYINDHVQAKALKQKNNQPRISVLLSSDHTSTIYASRKQDMTRAVTHSNDNVGISFKNKTTEKFVEFLIDNSNVTKDKKYEYKGLTHDIFFVDTKDLEPGTYEYRTYMIIDGEKTYSDDIYEFTKVGALCPDENHPHWIDLGLPSGTKWACCNEGATTPEGFGGYYTYGQVSSAPSLGQIKELIKKTTSVWTTQNGVFGRKYTGSNGGTIFLPAAGWLWNEVFYSEGVVGFYWSSTSHPAASDLAYTLYFDSDDWDFDENSDYHNCKVGLSIRPVR